MLGITASALLAGCVDYLIADPDEEVEPPVVVEERFVQAPVAAVDVLFVVDDTGSMASEQAALAAAAERFVAALDALGVSYQIGVTDTSVGDGGVLVGRPWIITSATEAAGTVLAENLQVGTDGTGPAAGLAAAAAALEDTQGLNRGFRRAGAALQVVFVSDGDDESDEVLGEDPASAFLALLAAQEEANGHAARASAVVGNVPAGCEGEAGSALPGTRYASVAEASGGLVASICAADFDTIADSLGDGAVEWPTTFELQAVPADGTVRVTVDGVRVTSGWSIDTDVPALIFEQAPAPDAAIEVRYELEAGG